MIRAGGLILLLMALADTATAQTRDPIGPFVVDARVALPGYKGSATVATALGVDAVDLPTRGLGLVVGTQFYPVRKRLVTFGVGAELMTSARSRTRQPATEGAEAGPTVRTRLTSLSPQISFNFGHSQGWSYISGGIGFGRFTTELADTPPADGPGRVRVINYGGGARWVTRPHLALSLDLRFYAINPQAAAAGRPAYPRLTSVVFSAGVGIK